MKDIKEYFDIKELVCRDVYNKFGEKAWAFFDPRLLSVLTFIRTNLGKPMTVNNWSSGGNFSQRGFRCNMCDLVNAKTKANTLYCSAHMRGQGVDFDAKGCTAEYVRQWIVNNAYRLPYNVRLEDGVNWVHIDVCNDTEEKVKLFKV